MSLKVWLPLTGTLENKGLLQLPNTSVNNFTYEAGKIGQCGTGRVAWHLSDEILGNIWSVAMWVKPTSLGSANNILFCKNSTASTDCQIYFSIISTTQLNLGVNGPSSSITATGLTFTLGTWYHVAATYNGSVATLYLNGTEVKHGTVTTAMPTGRLNMNINGRSTNAANTGTTGNFTSSYNDFRLYDHCLSAAEVKEISQGLVLHYKLDGFNNASMLPSQYQQLEYIESTGTSYFDTGTKFNIETDNCKVIFKGNDTSNNGMILASSSGKYFWFYYYGNSGIRIYANNGTDGQKGIAGISSDLNQHTMEFKNKTYYIDGVSKGSLSNTYTETSQNLWLFSYGGSSYPFKGRVYYAEINRNGAKTRAFIPAKRLSDAAIGMYDLITNTFCISSNAAFTAGTAVGTLTIQDSSGYGHNGTIVGDLILNAETKRYSASTKWNSSDPAANNETGICYIQTPITLTTPLQMSITWWAKPENGYGSGTGHAALCTSNNTSRPTDYNTTAFHHRDSGFDIYPSDASGVKRLSFTYTKNEWHHYALTYDGTTARSYQDGVEKSTVTVGTNKTLATFSQLYIGYSQAGGVKRKTLGSYSDFRMYCTALSADDIKQLYQVGAKVDNLGGLHTFELNENGSNKLTKNGIFKDYMVEPFITLSDGSKWQLLLYHQVNNGTNLFTSSNAGFNNGFGLYSRLNYIDNFTYDSKYEFYVIQDGAVHRWTQTNAPLTTTSVTGFTAITGSPGSGICKCNGNTLLAKTGTTSNWWNACGCWTIYNGGIPGFGSSVICKQHLILYARISEPKLHIANLTAYSNNFIEL